MEEDLTLRELEEILLAARDLEYRKMKFQAGLKGVNLDDYAEQDDKFQSMKWDAEATAQGRSVDEVKFEEFGIQVISELE